MNGLDFEVKGPNVTKKAKARRRETDKIPLDIIPRGILVIPGHNSPSYNISSGGYRPAVLGRILFGWIMTRGLSWIFAVEHLSSL